MLASKAFDLTGRVAWITGSSRGIGQAIASHLHAHGATVVVHARGERGLDEVVRRLGDRVLAVTGDVRDAAAMTAVVTRIEDEFGRLDKLVCNVGGALGAHLADVDPADWSKMLDLNLTGSFLPAQAAHALLARSDAGAVAMISATTAADPAPLFGAYGAAKAGVEHLVRSLAAEWGPAVRVNAVAPGLVRTEGAVKALFGESETLMAKAGTAMAMARIGLPEDIAWAVHFLLSDAASYVTGSVLTVDGGQVEGVAQRIMRAMQ